MGSLNVNYDFAAYLRNMEVQLVEGQSKQGIDAGNVALKTPVYDWGYSGQFGDEINWGSSIVQVPWLLYKLYGDTQTMREHFDAMKTYMDFVARRKAGTGADAYIVTALLADWVSNEQTSQQMFGTWGYYLAAEEHGRDGDAHRPHRRRRDLRRARREHQDRLQQPLLQHDAAPLHRRRQRRDDRRDPGRAGDLARRRARARGRARPRSCRRWWTTSTRTRRSAAARTSAPATSASARSCAR